MKISVVIATYNRGEVLCNTIGMLLAQDFDDYEIIVVDQTPHYPAEVQRRLDFLIGTRVRYYKLPYPNVSAARNLGIRAAQAEIVNFLDDDVIIERDYIRLHYLNFVNPDKKIGAVTGLILDYEYQCGQDGLKFMKSRLAVKDEVKLGDMVAVRWLTTCNVSYLRKALFEAEMFDENMSTYCEDLDISIRVRNLGYQLLLNTKINVFHMNSPYGGTRSGPADSFEYTRRIEIGSFNYCALKNWRIFGIWLTMRILFNEYRHYTFCRAVIRKGPYAWLKKNLIYIRLMKRVISDLKKRKKARQRLN